MPRTPLSSVREDRATAPISPAPSAKEMDAAANQLREIVGRLRRRLTAQRSPNDPSMAEQSLLSHLDRTGPAAQVQLAQAQNVRPQSIGPILVGMEAAGLITRVPDPSDRRRIIVSLTSSGSHELARLRRQREAWLSEAMTKGLTPEERRTVVDGIGLLATLLDS